MLDPDRLADALVAGAKRYVDQTVRPLVERINTLEVRNAMLEARLAAIPAPVGIEAGFKNNGGCFILTLSNGKALDTGIRDGIDGKDGAPGRDGVDGRNGADGKDGKDGKDLDEKEIAAIAKREADAAVASRTAAANGQGPDLEKIVGMIEDAIRKAIADIPKPKDGKDGKDGRDGIDGKDGRAGIGVAGAVINRDGELVLTLADGSTHSLGRVVGKDGNDGEPGKPGRDGFGFDNFTATLDEDGRTVILAFHRDGVTKEFRLPFPVLIDRGVWREGVVYAKGDTVSHGGSSFFAQRDTTGVEKPEVSDAWRLGVKRGRDGKDGKLVEPKPKTPLKVGV